MTLCDTGPLVALLNSGDVNHRRCVAALPGLASPLLTTWPCCTETRYLLGRLGGYDAQEKLWLYMAKGVLQLHDSSTAERSRMRALMTQYRDAPMDLADASLVAAAEVLNTQRIFTLDRHFYAYRLSGQHAFEVVP